MFSQAPGSTIVQENWFDEAIVEFKSDLKFDFVLS